MIAARIVRNEKIAKRLDALSLQEKAFTWLTSQ